MDLTSLNRRLKSQLKEDLAAHKMVFVSGPRQCGKTTLANQLLSHIGGQYFSWDIAEHRQALRKQQLPADKKLWVFDELHKMRGWRNWLKGVYDLHGLHNSILVTGSARLDLYRRGGDSLQGRYYLHRLHPFTLSELCGIKLPESIDALPDLSLKAPRQAEQKLRDLLLLSGFPEPLLSGSERRAARWRLGYGTRLVREDVRDLESLRDLDKIELLYDRLPDVVGSMLSINALREDLEVAYGTARQWLMILERLFAIFRVSPLGAPRVRAVRKEQKLYLWDWSRVPQIPFRFENLVLLHLLRLVHWLEDFHGEKAELRYFRDVHGREVDAIILRRGKPWMAVEVKTEDRPLDAGLKYLLERFPIPWAFQISLKGTLDQRLPPINGCNIRLVPATRFLANLP